jgi:hypothetical protein
LGFGERGRLIARAQPVNAGQRFDKKTKDGTVPSRARPTKRQSSKALLLLARWSTETKAARVGPGSKRSVKCPKTSSPNFLTPGFLRAFDRTSASMARKLNCRTIVLSTIDHSRSLAGTLSLARPSPGERK